MLFSTPTLFIAALGLGSGVLARPTAYLVDVATTHGEVAVCVDSDLTCITRRDAAAPIDHFIASPAAAPVEQVETVTGKALGVVEGLVPAVVGTVNSAVGKVNSAVSSITRRALGVKPIAVDVLSASVGTLKHTVGTELQSITATIETLADIPIPEPNEGVIVVPTFIPALQTSLATIASAMNTTITELASVLSVGFHLTLPQITTLYTVLTDLKRVVAASEDVLTTMVDTVSEETRALIAEDVRNVINLMMPLVTPVTAYAAKVDGLLATSAGEVNEVQAAAEGVKGAAESFVDDGPGSLVAALAREQ